MNDKFQDRIRTVIYSIFALIIGVVLIRILLKLVGANETNTFAQFWYDDVSKVFVQPWFEIYESIPLGNIAEIETYSIIALFFYMLFAVIASKGAASFFEDGRKQVIMEIVDSLFKAAEFLLATRFIFKLTAASTGADFVNFIYNVSQIVYEPFETLLPAQSFLGGTLEFSTLIALIVITILDLVTEQLLFSILSAVFQDGPKKEFTNNVSNTNMANYPPQGAANQQYQNPNPQQPSQNININIPQQPPQSNYVDRRSVNVLPPNQQPQQPQRRGILNPPRPRSSREGGPASS